MKQDSYTRCGLINELLWSCAGVNKNVLRQCPSDYAKYAGIGGTILFTALMACFSGAYALYFVFDNIFIASLFGIFWGLLIFNLDRFIVNTMYSDGQHTISWAELKSGLPRIIMAIFLGIVISTPLELRIFKNEINVQMKNDQRMALEEYVQEDKALLDSLRIQRDRLREAPLDPHFVGSLGNTNKTVIQKVIERDNLKKEENELSTRISHLTTQIRTLYGSSNHNDSIEAKRLDDIRTPLKTQLNTLRFQIQELNILLSTLSGEFKSQLKKAEHQREEDIKALDSRISNLDNKIISSEDSYQQKLDENFGGLRSQMKAFSELRDQDLTTNIAAWFIMILFVIIETAPTFFKMMMQDGAYDNLLNSERHRVKVLAQKRISDANDEVNTAVKISTMKNQKRLEAEILANEEVLKKLAIVQAELLNKSIEAWKAAELKKIDEDPTSYLKVSIKPEKTNK